MKKITSIILCFAMIICVFTVCGYAETENPFYLVLGDSIAYGSGISNSREACYGKIVADTNGYDYANHSVPGLERNEQNGVIYHREGVNGDYDYFTDTDNLIDFILNGKNE